MSARSEDRYQIDMCHGPLLGKIVLFSIPLMFSGILQLLFNAADLVVIGQYASHESMAAIGATLYMNSLLISLFMGLSVGTNVAAAKRFGAGDRDGMDRTVHTSILLALTGGIVLTVIGLLAARPMLRFMDTPEQILDRSEIYLKICFAGIPFVMLSNFGSAVLRAVGDTRRPLYFLIAAGVLNVLLNLLFVLVFHMDVAGVALATSLSHGISAFLILRTLARSRECYHLDWRRLRIDGKLFREILAIGVPSGMQGSCFALSNVIIQSVINTFGACAIAGNTATITLEGIIYVCSFSGHQAVLSFTAQNFGGKKFKRIRTSFLLALLLSSLACLAMGWGFYLSGESLLKIFNPDPNVIRMGMLRMEILFTTYLFHAAEDVTSGMIRGLGYSTLSMVLTLAGACLFRIFWVFCVFPQYKTLECLYWSYPISWALVALFGIVTCVILFRKTVKKHCGIRISWTGTALPRGCRYLGSPK